MKILSATLVMLTALPSWGDEIVLRDGRKLVWKTLSDDGDSYAIETRDGEKLKVKKSEVERVVVAREPAAPPLTGASFTMDPKKSTTTDLLPKVQVNGDTWKAAGKLLVAQATWPTRAVVPVDFEAPEEYDLTLVVERADSGNKDFAVGIVAGGSFCAYHFDAWEGTASCLALIGGEEGEHTNGQVFRQGKSRLVKLQVRRDALMVLLDGKEFWKGRIDWKQVKPHQAVTVKEKGKLFLVAAGGSWKVSAFTITNQR